MKVMSARPADPPDWSIVRHGGVLVEDHSGKLTTPISTGPHLGSGFAVSKRTEAADDRSPMVLGVEAAGRREAKLPLELRRRISGIGDVDHEAVLTRRLGVKDEAPPSAGPQFRDLACASQGVRES